MAIQIFNKRMAKTRIAELCAEIKTNGGTAPTNCDGFKTSQESRAAIAKLESILATCRARKASAKPGSPAMIACLSEKLTAPTAAAVREAITARIDAGKAALAAAEAKARAKTAAAALKPATLLDQYSAMPAGAEKIAFLAKHSVELQNLAKEESTH